MVRAFQQGNSMLKRLVQISCAFVLTVVPFCFPAEAKSGGKARQEEEDGNMPDLAALLNAQQSEPTLKPGSAAPKLDVEKWVQGDAVKSFETDKVYVVEFWATWCGPCVESIPHLNEIARKNKDKGVVVIGVNAMDGNEKKIAKMIQKMGTNMTYRIAIDKKDKEGAGVMASSWLEAFGLPGIPVSFVVGKDGKIVWGGRPQIGLDRVVEAVLAGNFDAKKEAALEEADMAKMQAEAEKMQEKMMALAQAIQTAVKAKKWDEAMKTIDDGKKDFPAEEADALEFVRFQVLVEKKDGTAAQKILAGLAEKMKDDEQALTQIAWMIATTKGLEKRDLALAEKLVGDAATLAGEDDPMILDTTARIQFMKGDKEKAIATQAKAAAAAEGDAKAMLEATLDSYKAGKLPPADDDLEEVPGLELTPAKENAKPDADAKPADAKSADVKK